MKPTNQSRNHRKSVHTTHNREIKCHRSRVEVEHVDGARPGYPAMSSATFASKYSKTPIWLTKCTNLNLLTSITYMAIQFVTHARTHSLCPPLKSPLLKNVDRRKTADSQFLLGRGSHTRPLKRVVPVLASCRAKKKGRSARTIASGLQEAGVRIALSCSLRSGSLRSA
jgi:hypothetical protein